MELKGTPVSGGIGIGPIFLYEPFHYVPPEQGTLCADSGVEEKRYHQARQAAAKELTQLMEEMSHSPDQAKIFQAHIDIVNDEAMVEEIIGTIQDDKFLADHAVHTVYSMYSDILANAEDPLIRERALDLKDVASRLIRLCLGKQSTDLRAICNPVILATYDLYPSDTALLDPSQILGIVTEIGGSTSHTAILAKNYGIPAVLGVSHLLSHLQGGETAIVNGLTGRVIIHPSDEELKVAKQFRGTYLGKKAEEEAFLDVIPITQDGAKIDVCLNIGTVSDNEFAMEPYTDGVGLFRTEFLYMQKPSWPTEEEQFEAYKTAVLRFQDRPVIIRTLDIGADKQLDYLVMPKEDNPCLGLRALRFSFEYMPQFKAQLRACLRAGVYGKLQIMFPMVGSIGDIRFARQIVEDAKKELREEGIPFDETIKLGIMIEIPSIAMMADVAASEVDFASIGTNDLCQYLTAVDRLNPNVAQYYQSFHPAMFRMIGQVVQAFGAQGKEVSVCGEMGGDPLASAVLIGLGIRKLSMNASAVASIKKQIVSLNLPKAQRLAQTVLRLSTAAQVESFLRSEFPDDTFDQSYDV